jgi:hypothetical protein
VVDAAPSALAATTTAASSYDYESIYATFDSPPGTGCVVSSALVLGSSQTNATPQTELRVLSQQYDLCADQLISNSDVYGGVTDSNLSVAPNARSAVLYGTVAGTDLVSGSAATATVDLTGQANVDAIRSGSTNLSVSRGLVTLDHVGNVFARADYAGSVAVAPGPSFEGSATYGYIDRFRWLHH